MSDAVPSNEPITVFAKELAQQLPVKAVYQDVAAPAAQQTGQVLTDIVKTIQLALAPLQFLAAYQDRLRNFIDRSVRRVPEDKRVSPPPQILGPIIEGVRYEPEGTPIDEMFSQLLNSSLHSDRVNEPHPSFPFLIKQLSSDEAKIIRTLAGGSRTYVFTRDFDPILNLFLPQTKVEIDKRPSDGLTFPENIEFYLEHLHVLGLAGVFQEGNQEAIEELDARLGRRVQVGVRVRTECRLTDLGKRLALACTDKQNT